jgi:hypothetical protein
MELSPELKSDILNEINKIPIVDTLKIQIIS